MNALNQEKIAQSIRFLKQEEIDMWILYASEGADPAVSLVTGLHTIGPTVFVFTKEGKKLALCSRIDAQESEQSQLFDEVRKYQTDLSELFPALLDEVDPQQIAINCSQDNHLCDGLTVGRYRWLKRSLGDVYGERLVSSESFLKKLRSIKTPEEIYRIQEAVNTTTDIFEMIFSELKVGLSELQVSRLFLEEMEKHNVVMGLSREWSMPIVLKEKVSVRAPGNAVTEPGDSLIVACSVEYQGYVSDLARTAYFLRDGETEAPKQMQDSFAVVHEAITRAKEAIKPGRKGYEVDQVARQYLLEQGMPESTHATGYQIGRATHDSSGASLGPRWDRYGSAPMKLIEANMVFTLEPTIIREDGTSIIVEENVVVTETGAEFISKRQDEIILIHS